MDILFGSRNEERLCTETGVATREFGAKVAKVLGVRITQLRAAPNLAAFTFGKPHPLKGDRAGCTGIWLDGATRIVVRPANVPVPVLPDGGLDRANVTILCVEGVGNYHD